MRQFRVKWQARSIICVTLLFAFQLRKLAIEATEIVFTALKENAVFYRICKEMILKI